MIETLVDVLVKEHDKKSKTLRTSVLFTHYLILTPVQMLAAYQTFDSIVTQQFLLMWISVLDVYSIIVPTAPGAATPLVTLRTDHTNIHTDSPQ
jgi:hypothetical protein